MKKHLISLYFFCCLPALFWAQSSPYYVKLDDASGFNTAPYQDSLEAHAQALNLALPEAFRSQFRVYDFGFYLHQEVTDGYPDVFEKKRAEIATITPYYLIFGKQTDKKGIYTKFWVEVKLPEGEDFACFSTPQREFLKINILTFANNIYSKSASEYAKTEMLVMDSIKHKIQKIIECCAANNEAPGCANCPEEDEIDTYFTSGLHGRYTEFPIFITDSIGVLAKNQNVITYVEDYTNNILFHEDLYENISSYYTALAAITNEINDSLKVKVFVTRNENFCDPELFNKLLNDFNDSDFSFAYHIHYFKRSSCVNSNERCDWVLSKFFRKKKIEPAPPFSLAGSIGNSYCGGYPLKNPDPFIPGIKYYGITKEQTDA
jgi:hypothetical protein